MTMEHTDYNGYLLKATAFQDEEDQWIGQATVWPLSGVRVRIEDPMVFDNQKFNSKTDAEDFALFSAQIFVDEELDRSGSE